MGTFHNPGRTRFITVPLRPNQTCTSSICKHSLHVYIKSPGKRSTRLTWQLGCLIRSRQSSEIGSLSRVLLHAPFPGYSDAFPCSGTQPVAEIKAFTASSQPPPLPLVHHGLAPSCIPYAPWRSSSVGGSSLLVCIKPANTHLALACTTRIKSRRSR